MRITRREFMKYCAVAAGALGLTGSQLAKIEKAMATEYTDGGTHVIWLNGQACTGCTTSLANTIYYASIQDLLVNWDTVQAAVINVDPIPEPYSYNGGVNGPLDLDFMETLSSSVGATAANAAKAVKNSSEPYVLCIEGAIPTAEDGAYCVVGDGTTYTDTATISTMEEVQEYAEDENCAAIIAVGTCASFGGIPAAKGSVTGARGLVSTGSISGGYQKVNVQGLWDYLKENADYGVASVSLTSGGSGYTAAPTVSFSGGGGSGASASAYISTVSNQVTAVAVTAAGTGYESAPTVSFSGGGGAGAQAIATLGVNWGISTSTWEKLMAKTICISGCPPHPDWIVGTIVYFLTYGEPPLMDKYHRPFDFYGQYQCTNCLWAYNNTTLAANTIDNATQSSKSGRVTGDSPNLYYYKYNSTYEGCIGVLGCKGRKTKADCSYRYWNGDGVEERGVSWCVMTRGGCHGCTEPRFPDGWGKFFSYK